MHLLKEETLPAERTPLTVGLSLCRVQLADSGTFSYANPQTIHWGPGSLARCLAQELDERRAERAFVITTRSVAGNPALGGALARLLGTRAVGQFSAISQHAPAATVDAATKAAAEASPDVLISFGGGSPIDAAKAVAFALATGLDLLDPRAAERAQEFKPSANDLLPQLAIPTTLSAAELAGLAGFATESAREKVGLRGDAL